VPLGATLPNIGLIDGRYSYKKETSAKVFLHPKATIDNQ